MTYALLVFLVYLCLLALPGQMPFLVRLVNVAFAIDCMLFAIVTLGRSYQGESFSSSAHRARINGMAWGAAEPVIDWLWRVLFGQRNHCQDAYLRTPINALPPEQR